jgi:hypothetical protein
LKTGRANASRLRAQFIDCVSVIPFVVIVVVMRPPVVAGVYGAAAERRNSRIREQARRKIDGPVVVLRFSAG